jgi:16S rRNA (guanine527-N7)-methyltransferase
LIPAGWTLPATVIAEAVEDWGLNPLPAGAAERFAEYYDLLERWNAKLNLTAIRKPEEVLRRHFLECIFCAQQLPGEIHTLLDYGSGGGFPGIPIVLCRPEIEVTLAESQAKKASFLREAVRILGLNAEVYANRVEAMEKQRRFAAVTLRAVDKMEKAVLAAVDRVDRGGWLVLLANPEMELPEGFESRILPLPGRNAGSLILASRQDVPRGTIRP